MIQQIQIYPKRLRTTCKTLAKQKAELCDGAAVSNNTNHAKGTFIALKINEITSKINMLELHMKLNYCNVN